MNTKLQKDKTINPWDELLSFKTEKEELEHDAQMLMYSFLGEVEKHQELQSVNKKTLAEKIKTSASYITQLFRGNKPLNFYTLASIQKALKIRFRISATVTSPKSFSLDIPVDHYLIAPNSILGNSNEFNKDENNSLMVAIKGGQYYSIAASAQTS